MGDPAGSAAKRQRITIKGQEFVVEEERKRVASAGSSISFFKNGAPQGKAFKDVWAEVVHTYTIYVHIYVYAYIYIYIYQAFLSSRTGRRRERPLRTSGPR